MNICLLDDGESAGECHRDDGTNQWENPHLDQPVPVWRRFSRKPPFHAAQRHRGPRRHGRLRQIREGQRDTVIKQRNAENRCWCVCLSPGVLHGWIHARKSWWQRQTHETQRPHRMAGQTHYMTLENLSSDVWLGQTFNQFKLPFDWFRSHCWVEESVCMEKRWQMTFDLSTSAWRSASNNWRRRWRRSTEWESW